MGHAARLTALLCFVAVGISAPALADDKPQPEDPRRAKQLYNLGKKLFAAKEYAEAANTFAESFGYDPRPAALFNEGRCHEEAGDKKAAISAYKRYVTLEPDGPAAAEARTRTLALERQLELEGELEDGSKENGKHNDDRGSSGRTMRLTGISVGAAGVLVFATGVFYGLKASSISSELEDRDPVAWTDAEIDRFNEGERAETLGIAFMSIGAAAAIGGGVLYYLGHREAKRSKKDIAVTPVVTPTSAGASLSFDF